MNGLDEYQRTAVMSATPAQLVTMLYDRLLLDLHRAEQAQLEARWLEAGAQLRHAQDIVAELQSSLDRSAWDGAEGLAAVYEFVFRSLVDANLNRDVELTRDAIRHLEPLRTTWHEAAAGLRRGGTDVG